MQTGKTPIYNEFYGTWLGHPASTTESLATCAKCAMVPDKFTAEVKCCAYFPFLPNFSVGAILQTRADQLMIDALKKGRASPLGLFARSEAGVNHSCPFLNRGECSIWDQRPAVCSSYFCKSSRGDEGLRQWKEVESYVNGFEWTLAHDVLWRMGFTQDDIRAENWFEYRGNELGFYAKAYQTALEIAPSDVQALMDLELKTRIESYFASGEHVLGSVHV